MKLNESKYSAKTGKPYDKANPRPKSSARYLYLGYRGDETAREWVMVKPYNIGRNAAKRVRRAQRR